MFSTRRRKIIAAVLVLVLATGLYSTFQIGSAGLAGKAYLQALDSGVDVDSKAANFSQKVSNALDLASAPVIKQILGAFGVDFSAIKPEIATFIAASPIVLGGTKAQRYMIAFQNSAEARGTGGILGAYAIIELKRGKLSVIETGSNAALKSLNKLPISISSEYLKLYGNNPSIWQNSNLSPHFPYGARMWMALWQRMTGEKLDGVIAVDPSALGYILKSTGNVTLASGEVITADDLVSKTLSTAYKKYETDNDARKRYLVEIMNATFTKILQRDFSKVKFAKALERGILENRILFFSANAKAEQLITNTRLSGSLTAQADNQFRVVIQNIDASKLDYYLARDVAVNSTTCDNLQQTQVRVTVTNTLDKGDAKNLPDYVLTRADKGKPSTLKTGQHRFKVFIYGPVGASIVSASRENTKAEQAGGSSELGRPIIVTDVDLAPGQSELLIANFAGGAGKITYWDQPLVIPTKVAIHDNC